MGVSKRPVRHLALWLLRWPPGEPPAVLAFGCSADLDAPWTEVLDEVTCRNCKAWVRRWRRSRKTGGIG